MGNLLDLFVFKYNRTDFHELNLDWIISDLKTLAETLKNFISLNTIKYADPIQWNIAKQYEENTVVVDPATSIAYLSTNPVPSGVALSNTDYWTPIFNLNIMAANNNITLRDDGNNILATFTSNEGDWLLWNGTLYRVRNAIALNEAYVVGYNIDRYTVQDFIDDIQAVVDTIGDVDDLNTTNKDTTVDAINEINNNVGVLPDLTTTDKSSIVNAINEIDSKIDDYYDNAMIINVRDLGAVGDGVTDDTAAFNAAIALVNGGAVKIIYIPGGRYRVSTLTPITAPCKILGAGRANTILDLISGHGIIFNVLLSHQCEISDLYIYESDDTNNAYTIHLSEGNYIRIHDIRTQGIKNFIFNGSNTIGDRGYMTHIDHIDGTVFGVFIQSNGNRSATYVDHCNISSDMSHNMTGISVDDQLGLDTFVVTDCVFYRPNNGVEIASNSGIITSNIWFDNVIIDGLKARGVCLYPRSGKILRVFMNSVWTAPEDSSNTLESLYIYNNDANARVAGVVISNWQIPYNYGLPFNIYDVDGLIIRDNYMSSYNGYGMYLRGCSNVMINNNMLSGDGSGSPITPTHAITCAGSTNNPNVSGILVATNNLHDAVNGVEMYNATGYRVTGNLGAADATG